MNIDGQKLIKIVDVTGTILVAVASILRKALIKVWVLIMNL